MLAEAALPRLLLFFAIAVISLVSPSITAEEQRQELVEASPRSRLGELELSDDQLEGMRLKLKKYRRLKAEALQRDASDNAKLFSAPVEKIYQLTQKNNSSNETSISAEKRNEELVKTVWQMNAHLSDYLYQEDILLVPEQVNKLLLLKNNSADKNQIRRRRGKRKSIPDSMPQFKWSTMAPIAYVLADNLSLLKKQVIAAALNYWQNRTCLSFAENGAGADQIVFFNGSGCFSKAGRVGGFQQLSIGDGCELFGIVAHEIGHALGFFHEQARADRDNFVAVQLENVVSGMVDQFDRYNWLSSFNLPYEYGSLMHYGDREFAVDPALMTLKARDPQLQNTMGQRTLPSFYDVLEMNKHYDCLDRCKDSRTICENDGYTNPNDCTECICPLGFDGRFCERHQWAPAECGGALNADEQWRTLTGDVGPERLAYVPTICSWLIRAPDNGIIEAKITHINGFCFQGCIGNAVQLKAGYDLRATGYRQCCTVNESALHTYRSDGALMPVIAEAYLKIEFTVEYRYVLQSGVPFVNSSMTSSSSFAPSQKTVENSTGDDVDFDFGRDASSRNCCEMGGIFANHVSFPLITAVCFLSKCAMIA